MIKELLLIAVGMSALGAALGWLVGLLLQRL